MTLKLPQFERIRWRIWKYSQRTAQHTSPAQERWLLIVCTMMHLREQGQGIITFSNIWETFNNLRNKISNNSYPEILKILAQHKGSQEEPEPHCTIFTFTPHDESTICVFKSSPSANSCQYTFNIRISTRYSTQSHCCLRRS